MAGLTSNKPLVALIGTLDTKRAEYEFAASYLEERGCRVYIFDVSTRPPFERQPDFVKISSGSKLISPANLYEQAPETSKKAALEALERSQLRQILGQACGDKLVEMQASGDLDAIASFGGSQNTSFATSIMRSTEFPIGLPKLMMTTMASGDISEYIGESDICIMPSVGDISGSLNGITETTLRTALSAIAGMAIAFQSSKAEKLRQRRDRSSKPMVAISMFGVTTLAVQQISSILQDAGLEPVAFHATGSGGRMMERLIREGFFAAVIDLTTTELCDHLYDGVLSAGPDRMTAASWCGVPQVVSVGALDMINFGSLGTLPSRYELLPSAEGQTKSLHLCKDGSKVYEHNSQVTLVRTTPDQNVELGQLLIRNIFRGLSNPRTGSRAAPIHIMFPKAGISAMDGEEGVWEDSQAREQLLHSIKDALEQELARTHEVYTVTISEYDVHINSPEFARIVAAQAIRLVESAST